ncbi:MAG: DEAD/DEAH box helicase [Candidatus Algichlamydia australiensis]|nr:DEAD/DEAH box helicase [Chlamydiales bacterium]
MLNFRKLKQDFSSSTLQEGKAIYDEKKVQSAKILELDGAIVRIQAMIAGQFEKDYSSEIEIDRSECETIDSNCDCPYHCDCQHLAALLFYLEDNLDEILVNYSNENDMEEHEELLEVVKEAQDKQEQKLDEEYRKQLIEEYALSSKVLSTSPFFVQEDKKAPERAELAVFFSMEKKGVQVQLAMRLPSRSKPLHIPEIFAFADSVCFEEPIEIGGKQYFFTYDTFPEPQQEILRLIFAHMRPLPGKESEKAKKCGVIEKKTFGAILAKAYAIGKEWMRGHPGRFSDDELPRLPCFFEGGLESPLHYSLKPAQFEVELEYIQPPAKKILLNPRLDLDGKQTTLEEVEFFRSPEPGLLHDHTYWHFDKTITRRHLEDLSSLREITIPEPLFGTFVENSLSELLSVAKVAGTKILENFTTLPFVGELKARCDISYLEGEFDATLTFLYDDREVPAARAILNGDHVEHFVTEEGIIARDLVAEHKIIKALFSEFIFSEEQGIFIAGSEKVIIEFMTDIIPRFQDRITFNCPQNLLDQFIYDESHFTLKLSETDRMDLYEIDLKVEGSLRGVFLEELWDCILCKRPFLELKSSKKKSEAKLPKILVLNLDVVTEFTQLFDELGIEKLANKKIKRPLWSLANIDGSQFESLPVTFTMTERLQEIRQQMLGVKPFDFSGIPKEIKADLRPYQVEGVQWLERLRSMYLNGILADDMGLGKTLQAITALTQSGIERTAMVVCPTSLLYNWMEELHKFNPKIRALVIDGIPTQRKKIIEGLTDYDVVITSYSLLQKDIDHYQEIQFSYLILDEAQHIKNRGTRNAKSVKQVGADYRLILSGTPIENSLDELWSLFDFLMPGFLSSYERFIEKYVRVSREEQTKNLAYLKKKVSPFILRRMKADVLKDLPPVSEIVYHCQLSNEQKELYRSYAKSARDELTKLVERDGFDKVQIHVLATLTRLKQICCHPAIFAKEHPEAGDSAKYEMLLELLETLIEGGHKTVIFSQYTKMLKIMRDDFDRKGIRYSYLDGTSKNRLEIVDEFNNDKEIPIFLVSLKAGGTGLNLVGADTVIHYDMWWNPAVESQATDRVHRMGQKQAVSVYKLITLSSIEEKIVELQNRKKGIVKKVVSCDEEAIAKLTWEDVLELLQT